MFYKHGTTILNIRNESYLRGRERQTVSTENSCFKEFCLLYGHFFPKSNFWRWFVVRSKDHGPLIYQLFENPKRE